MQNDETAARQEAAADLRAKIMELAEEFRRQILRPLLRRDEEWRHQGLHRRLVHQRRCGAVQDRDHEVREYGSDTGAATTPRPSWADTSI